MRVVISHAYSTENKGDAALLDVLVGDIRRQYGSETTIDILTIDKVAQGATFADAPLHEAFMYYALNRPRTRVGKLCYAVTMMAYTLLWAWMYRVLRVRLPLSRSIREVVELYLQADMIITVGGGYFRTSGDMVTFVNLLLMLHPLRFAEIIAKPTYLYTMSVGPFYHGIERRLVAARFRRAGLVLIREDTSMELLKNIGVQENVRRAVDSGFAFRAGESIGLRARLGVDTSRTLVGVTARKWMDAQRQDAYEQAMADALDGIIDRHDVDVVCVPQVTSTHNRDDDREVSRSIARRMTHTAEVHVMEDDYTHHDVKAMYDELDYIIGTRFHSVIFSLTSYVPAIAIEYEHKTSGIMRDLNLSQWTLKIEDVQSDKIQALFDELLAHTDDYKAQLQAQLSAYIARAEEAIVLVDEQHRNR